MSSALVRQALEFVDNEESVGEGKKRKPKRTKGQDHQLLYKQKAKKPLKQVSKPKEQVADENIKKLLSLSQPTSEKSLTEKILQRAITGKPLTGKIEVKKEEYKSILFADEPEQSFEDFENELFCR